MIPMYHCQIKLIPLQIMHTATICQLLYSFGDGKHSGF